MENEYFNKMCKEELDRTDFLLRQIGKGVDELCKLTIDCASCPFATLCVTQQALLSAIETANNKWIEEMALELGED